jgi:hypothetical protein
MNPHYAESTDKTLINSNYKKCLKNCWKNVLEEKVTEP